MPYKRIGTKVYHFKAGRWSLKQQAHSVANAKSTIRLLEGLEHGMKLYKQKKRGRR